MMRHPALFVGARGVGHVLWTSLFAARGLRSRAHVCVAALVGAWASGRYLPPTSARLDHPWPMAPPSAPVPIYVSPCGRHCVIARRHVGHGMHACSCYVCCY
eukprot:scaffold9289_cov111-Isochrysis_galbana.AAC.2